ncbi:MAG: Na/Pi cotransporter family protein [Lachnospiraceae bacterium]
MDFTSILKLMAGIGMFLFGMNLMASSIEKLAGAKLESTLERLTSNKWKALALGTGVTAVIQSSAATSITIVGFVNAGLMTLKQAIPVIWGSNIGSTATAQILRLGDLGSGSSILSMLKPSSFAPILIFVGAMIMLLAKKRNLKNIANLLIGFGILFFGMTTMEEVFEPLKESEQFKQLFTSFNNPVLGILAGLILTAIIQSSSASVGILQALSSTGTVTAGIAFPIILGQNVGKCLPIILASFGVNKNSKRASVCYVLFNIISLVLFGFIVCGSNAIFHFEFMNNVVNRGDIANIHTGVNLVTALLLMPLLGVYEKLLKKIVPDKDKSHEKQTFKAIDYLDKLLTKTPGLAMEQCHKVLTAMGEAVIDNIHIALGLFDEYSEKPLEEFRQSEDFLDRCEAKVSEYMAEVTKHTMNEAESRNSTKILQSVSDFERIGDYCVNLTETSAYMHENNTHFSEQAVQELHILYQAIEEIVHYTVTAYSTGDMDALNHIEPIEETVDEITDRIRNNHIKRLRKGLCTADNSISIIEILTNLERISDHCANIAVYIMQERAGSEHFDRRKYLRHLHEGIDPIYVKYLDQYTRKYTNQVPEI